MKAVQVDKYGGSEVLHYKELAQPIPKENEALIKLHAIGVNFIDVYHRTGLYPIPTPFVIGQEGAGVVEDISDQFGEIKVGDRVAFTGAIGSYSEYHTVQLDKLVQLPNEISFEQGAAAMLQGMTAHYLAFEMRKLSNNDTALVHAAAGGVGLLLIQLLKRQGVRVIGLVSNEEKKALAIEAGADEIILYTQTDFELATKKLTNSKGVEIVYDSVGKDTWEKSLNVIAPRGTMVSFGNASGSIAPFNPLILSQKGSLFLTRPSLVHYTANRNELLTRSNDIFNWIKSGELNLRIEYLFPLGDAKKAHDLLEQRKTTGKVLLIP